MAVAKNDLRTMLAHMREAAGTLLPGAAEGWANTLQSFCGGNPTKSQAVDTLIRLAHDVRTASKDASNDERSGLSMGVVRIWADRLERGLVALDAESARAIAQERCRASAEKAHLENFFGQPARV